MALVFFLFSIAMAKPTPGHPISHPSANPHSHPAGKPHSHPAAAKKPEAVPSAAKSSTKHAIAAPKVDHSNHAEPATKYYLGLDSKIR